MIRDPLRSLSVAQAYELLTSTYMRPLVPAEREKWLDPGDENPASVGVNGEFILFTGGHGLQIQYFGEARDIEDIDRIWTMMVRPTLVYRTSNRHRWDNEGPVRHVAGIPAARLPGDAESPRLLVSGGAGPAS